MKPRFYVDRSMLIAALLALTFAANFGLMSLQRLHSFSISGYDLTNSGTAAF